MSAPRGAQRHGLLSICLGNLVEFYDFAVFGGSAAVLAIVLTTGQGELTSIFAVLAAALIMRPIGRARRVVLGPVGPA